MQPFLAQVSSAVVGALAVVFLVLLLVPLRPSPTGHPPPTSNLDSTSPTIITKPCNCTTTPSPTPSPIPPPLTPPRPATPSEPTLSHGASAPVVQSVQSTDRGTIVRTRSVDSLRPPRPPAPSRVTLPRLGFRSAFTSKVDLWQMAGLDHLDASCNVSIEECPMMRECGAVDVCRTESLSNIQTLRSGYPETLMAVYPDAYRDGVVVALRNVFLGWTGHVVTPQGYGPRTHLVQYGTGMCPWGRIDTSRNQLLHLTLHLRTVISVVHVYSVGNFYHFLAETLPKYMDLLPFFKREPDATIVVAHHGRVFVELLFGASIANRTLVMRHWGSGKTAVDWNHAGSNGPRKFVFASRALVPLMPACGLAPLGSVKKLRYHYLNTVGPELVSPIHEVSYPTQSPEVVVYGRNNFTTRRAIVQHGHIVKGLVDALGRDRVVEWGGLFTSTLVANLSPLWRAKVFVGPHGAGLAAMIFLPPNATVVEIRPHSRTNSGPSCFEHLAAGSGLQLKVLWASGTKDTKLNVVAADVIRTVVALVQ